MNRPDHTLGGLPAGEFLGTYWQKQPVLIRGAFPDFESPITPEELAGLALEEEAESRLIMERGGDYPWQLRCGPFEEDDFLHLPESHWTLLVQEVDRWVPEVADLLEHFQFVPGWRLDDVMVSYAPDAGSVGAHVDSYDVFLLQGLGRRQWRIGTEPLHEEVLVPDVDVSMLARFEPDDVMLLEPGDMLYLPPRVAHEGIAVGDCMTFSVGFRAPSHQDILTTMLGRAIEETDPLARYTDPDLTAPDHPGRVGPDAVAQVRRVVRETLTDERIARWFGMLVTEPTRGEPAYSSPKNWTADAVARRIQSGAELVRRAPHRIAFMEHADGRASLFAHGREFLLGAELAYAAALVAGREALNADSLKDSLRDGAFQVLLADLVNDGHLELSETA